MKMFFKKKAALLFATLLLGFSSLGVASCGSTGNNPAEDDNSLTEDPKPKPIYNKSENDYLFYSDDYFRHRASRYNEHLATLSMYMAKYSMNPGGPKNSEDYTWYRNQPLRLVNFYYLIGFEHPLFNDDYYARTAFDTIGIGCASRVVKEGDNEFTVIACTVRSGGYFNEWENNVFLGDGSKSDMMHEGWYNAANKVIDFIGHYLEMLKSQNWLKTTQIKLWLSGYSRGGAVMNLTGGLLDNKLGYDDSKTRFEIYEGVNLKREDILVYTFESPQGANLNSTTVEKPKADLYNNIFNIINPNDLVTKVAMARYGFTRFGIDRFITTEFFDPDSFEGNRSVTKALYADRDPKYKWVGDNYEVYNLDWLKVVLDANVFTSATGALINWLLYGEAMPDVISKDGMKVNYDANIGLDILIDYAIDNIGDRQSYCDNFQTFARGLMHYMFDDAPKEDDMTWKELLIYTGLQGLAYELLPAAEIIIEEVFDLPAITGATNREIDFALDIAYHLFTEYPSEAISLIYNIGDIFENHSTQLNVHHAQAQDSYYIEKYNDEHKDNYLVKVPYRKNSELTRFECLDINQGEIHVNGDIPLKMTGYDTGKSIIDRCDKGYAVGYYHYLTYERTEWFVPSCYDFGFGFYGHSDKPWHHVYVKQWTYRTNQNYNRTGKVIVDDYYNGNTDVFTGSYEKDCDPEKFRLSDLTGSSWYFVLPMQEFGKKSIDFTSNGQDFHSIQVLWEPGEMSTVVSLKFDDLTVASCLSWDYSMYWIDNAYKKVSISGGADVKNIDLINWFYQNAMLMPD